MLAKKVAIITLFALVGLGLLVIGQSSMNQLACEGQPINFRLEPTEEQQIWGDRILSQLFVSPRDGLNRIDVIFQTYERQNSHDINLHLLELSDDATNSLQGTSVADFSINASALSDRVWHTFNFPPIANSAGKTYLIQIQSPASVPGDAVTVGGIEWDTYAPGPSFLGPVPLQADIAFRACYQLTTPEKLRVLSQQITHDRPALWGAINFYWLSLMVYALLLVAFFWRLAKLVL